MTEDRARYETERDNPAIIGETEPLASKEAAIIAALRAAFAPDSAADVQVNSTETSATGLCLSPKFVTRLLMQELIQPQRGGITYRQHMILWLRFVRDQTAAETARHLHLSRDTVQVDQAAALQHIIRLVWTSDPNYVSGPRMRRLDPEALAEFYLRLARAPRGPDGYAVGA